MSIQILELFGHVTLQSGPRNGLRKFGVPPGGPFDRQSMARANALLGNARYAPALELAMAAVRLRFVEQSTIALAGAPCVYEHRGSRSSAAVIEGSAGEELRIEQPSSHARVYLAIHGGFQARSAEPLKKGVVLSSASGKPATESALPAEIAGGFRDGPIRVIPFESSHLPRPMVEKPFTVSMRSDRVGLRLEGAKFEPGPERLSEPACFGAIQVTNEGDLIILGPDGPTIGGYRKLGAVCSADFDGLGQLRPGSTFQFAETTMGEALNLLQNEHRK